MRLGIFIIILATYISAGAQKSRVETGNELASRLVKNKETQKEKVRAIFYWIAQNIEYRTQVHSRSSKYNSVFDDHFIADTTSTLQPLDELVADNVLKTRLAVCDGYARLFKTLCTYAGIEAEVISGYGRVGIDRVGNRFRSNHSWNAVKLDSTWHLLDVTWASGFISYSNRYIQNYDSYYFLTPPADFIRDHYPEDLSWSLMQEPPVLREFHQAPFKLMPFVKYPIKSFLPEKGIVNASMGDTLRFTLHLGDRGEYNIAPTSFYDSSMYEFSPRSAFLLPENTNSSTQITYHYIVNDPTINWLHIVFNSDVLLRYNLSIRKNK